MRRSINPKTVNVKVSYSAAIELVKPERWLFISGQVGRDENGNILEGVENQADQAWRNILTCLSEGDMSIDDIVDTTVYLVGRENNNGYDAVRSKYLGSRRPASTKIFVAGLAHPEMLCEIHAVAAR